jgi:ribosome-binding factor A
MGTKTPLNTKSVKDNYLKRVDADLLRVLSMAIRKADDPAVLDINILRVETSADLSSCRVVVTSNPEAMAKLQGFFKNEIAKTTKIKRVPNLRFVVDTGEDNAKRVEELLGIISRGNN